MNSWDRAQPLATVSAGRLVAALRACAPAVSFFADSPLSGVALHFQSTGQITLLASDGVCLAVRVEPAVVASTADAQIINVPGSTTSVLASFGEADVEIRLAQGTRSPLLLVRGEGAEVVEHELWSTRPQFDIYQAFTETSAGTTVSVAARELERAARVDCADGFTLAFTPGKLFVRTSAGLAGSPVSAVVSGASTRVALSPELLRHGWTFARAGASRGASSLVIEVLHDARILKIYGHDTDSQTFGSDDFYLSATGFRFAEFNTWLGLCETHVPGTPPAEATHPADPPAHPSGPAQVIDVDTVLAKLDAITGQAELKQQVKRLSAQVRLNRERQELGLRTGHPGTHMIFTGPPGTGKTTVARLIAELLHALGVLPEPRVVEVDKAGLVAAHVGGSEEKTTAAIQSAIGGVLFIDEAYALAEDQFGRSAIDVLLKALEDRRGEFVCIVAGYTDRMNEFVASNPGIRSRFLRTIDFTPYSTDELVHIGCAMATQVDNELDSGAVDALSARLRTEERRGTFDTPEWGNARSVRNVVDAALAARDLRIEIQEADEASAPVGPGERRRLLTTLTAVDIDQACDEFRIGVGGGSGESVEDVLAELGRQVGQEQLKRQVEVLLAGARAARLRADQGLESGRPDLPHLLFVGPPGTGKTTIARLLARLYKALGMLPHGQVVEVDRAGLVEGYVGQTALKTTRVVDSAQGGVLFIDEAYTLVNGKDDFGTEALDTLLKRMSDDQGRFLTIAAGYPDKMEAFLAANPGLKRRFATTIEFVAYTADELAEIAELMVHARQETLSPDAAQVLRRRLHAAERGGQFAAPDWGNAGSIANLVDAAGRARNLRLNESSTREELITMSAHDVESACDEVLGATSASVDTVESVLAELDAQIGQAALKRQVASLLAGVRAQQARTAHGLSTGGTLLQHLVFTGPPGTGKTTIARLLARLYRALGVLPQGHVVEVDRAGLVAGYLGQTATRTEEQIAKAMGGVLFIDEAYTLVGDQFGKESIDTLLARMENDRGKFMVIVAGYPEQMRDFIRSNPGLPSRFADPIDFEPYTADELTQIAASMAGHKGERLTPEAMTLLSDCLAAAERAGRFTDMEWGNARAVRNLVDDAGRRRNGRLFTAPSASPSSEDLVTLTAHDVAGALEAARLPSGPALAGTPTAPVVADTFEAPARASVQDAPRTYQPDSTVVARVVEIVAAVVSRLAPGAVPGAGAPPGRELAALGVREVYWQRARSGGGGGMGVQMRLARGSKDEMYYFAGGSSGALPAEFAYLGQAVPKPAERDLVHPDLPRTLADWTEHEDRVERIVAAILAGISADRPTDRQLDRGSLP